jgi:hypothetical protein
MHSSSKLEDSKSETTLQENNLLFLGNYKQPFEASLLAYAPSLRAPIVATTRP